MIPIAIAGPLHAIAAPRAGHQRAAATVAGALAAFLGAAVLLGWTGDMATLKAVLPGLTAMKANAALLFVVSGLAVALRTRLPPRWLDAAAALIFALAGATLFEQASGLDLRIDEWIVDDRTAPAGLAPGRMATVTAVTFMLVAMTLALLPRAHRDRRLALTVSVLAAWIATIGALGMLGYAFDFELLYTGYAYSAVDLHTAAGCLVLGLGLACSAPRTASDERRKPDQRVVRAATWLAVLGTATAGLTGFAVLESQLRRSLSAGLHAAIAERANQLETTVMLYTTRAQMVTTRLDLLRHLRLLAAEPDRRESIETIRGVLDGYAAHGFSGISLSITGHGVVARMGRLVEPAPMEIPLKGPAATWLLWRDGFYLRHQLPLADGAGRIGMVITEQPLPDATLTAPANQLALDSLELLICRPETQTFQCFPTRFDPQPLTLPRVAAGPAPYVAAPEEPSGSNVVLDHRGRRVLAAYGPVGELGLAAVLKVHTEELYRPLSRSLLFVLLLVAGLAVIAITLMRARLRPLVASIDQRTRELERSNRDLEHFAYVASHDLQEPLRAVTGCVQLLERRNRDRFDTASRDLLGHALSGTARMRALIEDLLVFSRTSTRAKSHARVDCETLIGEVQSSLAALIADRGARIVIDRLPVVIADPGLLRQVFQNLIANGLKFNAAAVPRVTVSADRHGEEWVFAVADNGIGIEPQFFERIFVAFQRLHGHDEYPGSGIGLAVCQRIVERHGGRIWVESVPGDGATFYFTLPAATVAPEVAPA